jgi:hypothetical protein
MKNFNIILKQGIQNTLSFNQCMAFFSLFCHLRFQK